MGVGIIYVRWLLFWKVAPVLMGIYNYGGMVSYITVYGSNRRLVDICKDMDIIGDWFINVKSWKI